MSVDIEQGHEQLIARIAGAVGEPARARMLYSLMSGRARTATELALVADVTPSTASIHLNRLKTARLVRVVAQGKHRYYSLDNERVAELLETLSVLAGGARDTFVPNTPAHLRAARTCYDHLAGTLGVALHDRLVALGWLTSDRSEREDAYTLNAKGTNGLESLGIDVETIRGSRRRFAFACLDWSERRPHVGGAIGAAILDLALRRRWLSQDAESRTVRVTALGRRELQARIGLRAE